MKYHVIALGGSIVVPHLSDNGGINSSFLRSLRKFLKVEMKRGSRFILVIGGGKTCRVYQKAARQVVRVSDEDLDWLGIHAIRLNAHLLRTVFKEEAYPVVLDHDPSRSEVATLKRSSKRLIVESAWRPGWSTDYVAVKTAQKFGAKEVVIAGDTPFVYDKDPKKFSSARPVKEISWSAYQKLIPSIWTPGLSSPVDPIAARVAKKEKITAKVLKGSDLVSFKKAIQGKPFVGSVIS